MLEFGACTSCARRRIDAIFAHHATLQNHGRSALEGSRYLDLAEKIISVRGVPLTGSQIIDFAEEYDALPFESYQTIVKTLQARIAEDIAKNRNKSQFFRTGIGKYFLRRLARNRTGYGNNDWLDVRGPRKKPEHPHRILTVPSALVPEHYYSAGWDEANRILEHGRYDYQSEIKSGFLPVITGAVLFWKRYYFSFRVGVHTHFEALAGSQCMFLRKFLDEFDLDLFETDGTGATSSTARAALPILAEGRRSRLEYGRLTGAETLQFYQVSGLLKDKAAHRSYRTNSLMLVSTVDLSSAFARVPATQRRLEINDPKWIGIDELRMKISGCESACKHLSLDSQ